MTETTARPRTGPGRGPRRVTSLADVTEDLFAVFGGRIDLLTIVRTVRACNRELDASCGAAALQAVARLAGERLNDLAGRLEIRPAAPPERSPTTRHYQPRLKHPPGGG